ncbi:MAG: component of SufBCD complex [Pelagimonas sp.]|nr:component of SufBCD complex [Pelagimonas sp.]
MDWYSTLSEMIDMRSFSNLWFWIVLTVVWSSTSHWVMGVPYDMVARARSKGGQAAQDLEDLIRINTNRLLFIVEESGLLLSGFLSAALTAMVLLGFVYKIEFAQALFLLSFPLTLIGILSVFTARRIRAGENTGEALWARLRIHRTITQFIGMVSIFVTAFWGIAQNATATVI